MPGAVAECALCWATSREMVAQPHAGGLSARPPAICRRRFRLGFPRGPSGSAARRVFETPARDSAGLAATPPVAASRPGGRRRSANYMGKTFTVPLRAPENDLHARVSRAVTSFLSRRQADFFFFQPQQCAAQDLVSKHSYSGAESALC